MHHPCIACGHAVEDAFAALLDPKTRTQTPYGRTVRCAACGSHRAHPMPDPSEVPGFYALESYYTQGAGHMPHRPATLADRLIGKVAYWLDRGGAPEPGDLAGGAPGRSLDVGAGGGDLVAACDAAGFEAWGMDPDPKATCHARFPERTHVGTAEDPPAGLGGRFDLVSMTHVLEHCVDPRAALGTVRAVLAEGGAFWVEVPNAACGHFAAFGPHSEMFDAPRHLHHFTPTGLRAALKAAGFTPKRTYYRGFQRHFGPTWRGWEAALFDAERAAGSRDLAQRHDRLASLRLLARTAFARPEAKYDCVGMICRAA